MWCWRVGSFLGQSRSRNTADCGILACNACQRGLVEVYTGQLCSHQFLVDCPYANIQPSKGTLPSVNQFWLINFLSCGMRVTRLFASLAMSGGSLRDRFLRNDRSGFLLDQASCL